MTDTPTTTGADAERREDDAQIALLCNELADIFVKRLAQPNWRPNRVLIEDARDNMRLAADTITRRAVAPSDPTAAVSFVRDNTKCTEEHALKIIHGVLARVSPSYRAGKLASCTAIEAEARRCAAMYEPSSDGRNTFIIFADWIANRAEADTADQQPTPHTPRIVDRGSGFSEVVLEPERPSRWSEELPGCTILRTIDGGDFNGARWPTRQLALAQRDVRERTGVKPNPDRQFEPSTLSVSDQIREHAAEIYKHGSDYSRDALFNIAQQLEVPPAPQPDAAPVPAAEVTEAAANIIDVMSGGDRFWRERVSFPDCLGSTFLDSADWQTACSYARAALAARGSRS